MAPFAKATHMLVSALMLAAVVGGPSAQTDNQITKRRTALLVPLPDNNDQLEAAKEGTGPEQHTRDEDEEEDEKGKQSGTIVITARRLDAARTSIDAGLGATVYELHNETIENRPGGETGSVGVILTQTPGVTLSGSSLSIRGSKAIQVRINDVIIPEAISDPQDRLSSRLAESTRLIAGSLPAQFGFAPGGVIAVTTKNGLYQHGGQAELFAGSHGAFEPAFEWGGSADSSSLFASGSLETGTSMVADVTGRSANDVHHEIGGLAFADHVIDEENRVSLILGGSRERRRIRQTDLPPGTEERRDAYSVGTLQHSTGEFTVQASLFAGHNTNSADFVQRQDESSRSVGTQIDSSFRTGTNNIVRGGLLLNVSRVHGSAVVALADRTHRTSLGLYLQEEWNPLPHLTVNAGLRADWLRSFSSSAAAEPRASIVWTSANGLTAHAGYARYASAPPLGEEPTALALPDEHDNYFDAGLQQKLGPITFGMDGYYRTAQNLIIEHKRPGDAVPTAFALSRARFRGLELSATYARGPVTSWANLTLSKSQGRTIIGGAGLFPAETIAAADARWVALASDRPLSASGGVTWRVGNLNLSADVLLGSGAVRSLSPANPNGVRAPAFATFGFAAVYHLKVGDLPLDVRADLTNLTNIHYLTNDAANLEGGWTRFRLGRSILIGFEQGF